jgi:cell division protein FtsI/penicillin-binding protein 2
MRQRAVRAGALLAILTFGVSTSAVPSRSSFDEICRRSLAGRPGAAVVLQVSDGTLLGSAGGDVLGRKVTTPGSAIKPFVLELALEHQRIPTDLTLACRRHLTIAGKRLDCTHQDIHASYDATEALALSCNSYFAAVGSRLEPGELERRYRELGFTNKTALVRNESYGRVVEARSMEDRQLLALGAAGIEITPLELATAYARLARAVENPTKAQSIVFDGLKASTEGGLGHTASIREMAVAGKTGTASDAGKVRTHAWFAGYAPADHPKIVVVVYLETGTGSVDAASVAHDIFKAYADSRR